MLALDYQKLACNLDDCNCLHGAAPGAWPIPRAA